MSIQRDENGYKVFDLLGGVQLIWAEEDNVLFSRTKGSRIALTTDVDAEFDGIMEAWEHTVVERERLRKELEEARKTKEKMINRDDLLVWLGDLLRDKDIEIARASHRLAREAATDEAKLIKTIIRNVEVQPYFVGRLGEGNQDAD